MDESTAAPGQVVGIGTDEGLAAGVDQRPGVGTFVGQSLDSFGAGLPLFVALAVPTAIGSALLATAFDPANVLLGLVVSVVGLAGMVAMTFATDDLRGGRRPELGQVVRRSLRRTVPVLLAYLVFALALIVLIVVVGILVAVVALVIGAPPAVLLAVVGAVPIMVLLVRWSLLQAAATLDGEGPVGALSRSWTVTRGAVWRLAGVWFVATLFALPATVGVSLLGAYAPERGLALVGSFVGALVTTPLFAIPLTVVYRSLSGRPTVRSELVPPRARRGTVLALVLGVGLVLTAAGVAQAIAAGGLAYAPDRGMVLAGRSENLLDPCRPGDRDTRFSTDDSIWIGAVLSRTIRPDGAIEVRYLIDGAEVVSDRIAADGQAFECYYEAEPLVGAPPGSYRVEVIHEGELVAEGEFVVE